MTAIFADTSFDIALTNARDVHHANALAIARRRRGRVVTTDYVLLEVGNWMSRTGDRTVFIALVQRIRDDADTTVVPGTRDWFDRGFELFNARHDKDWSLTDCISFSVMEQLGLTEALTADRHFEQAGFTVLLE